MKQDQTRAQSGDTVCHDPYYEFIDRHELQKLQLKRLQDIVQYVYEHVEYYRRSFTAARITPRMLTCLEDIKSFPFTIKDNLRTCYPFKMLAVPRRQIVRIHASSGTTGKPTVVGYTSGDIDVWSDLMARSMVCAGVKRGDIVQNAYNYGLFTGGFGVHYGAEKLGCSVIPMSGGNTEKQIMLMQDFGVHVLAATPSYALNIAEQARASGIDLAGGPLRIGLVGGEPSSAAMRKSIAGLLGIKVMELYGLSEVMGPGVAVECSEQAGMHGWEDHFLFEIIDPDSGETLPFEQDGELVITTLTRKAQPVIRFRTGDIARLTGEPCACGRSHNRLLQISGRCDDMLIIRGVNIYPSQIESLLIGFEGIAPHYQLVVEHDKSLDRLTIEVEALPGYAGDHEHLSRRIHDHIKSMTGLNCRIRIVTPGQIPRSEGKAVRVRDFRNNGC